MLRISDIGKSYGGQVIFDRASLMVQPRERIGLVGRNGSGKTTLFKMIIGEEEPDSGSIIVPTGYRTGHIEQHLNFLKPTLIDECCLGLLPEEIHDRYKAERILFGLGFTNDDLQKPPNTFSGGFQVRLNLAKVLVSNPNLLLLDEPTNYLDIVSIRWIIEFLRSWKHELILISHDRNFMDSVTTHTAIIHRKSMRKLAGNTAKLYAQIDMDETVYEQTRQNELKQRKHMEQFVERFRSKATKASAAQSRIKMLEKLPKREALENESELRFKFQYLPVHAKRLLEASGIAFGYGSEKPLFSELDITVHPEDRIAVIGKNGKGKSTLIKVLAGELKPQSGEILMHPDIALGYFGQTNIELLEPKLTVEEEISSANPSLGRTSVRSICGCMMFGGSHAEKKIQVLSGGEKSRVMFGKIIAAPSNVLLLDEPTNHLDMQSVDAMVDALNKYNGAAILVTHNEMILRSIATRLLVFQDERVTWFNGGYDEFLRKVGWLDEKEEKAKKEKTGSKKALRQQRGSIIEERSRVLGPLKIEIDRLEEKIVELEKKQAETLARLETASRNQNAADIACFSKFIKEMTLEIENCFSRLEIVDKEYERLSAIYTERLSAVE